MADAAPVLDPKRWLTLAVVGAAFFMTILDVTIVNIALPTIGTELSFSRENLQWLITAYAITFGGFLLLGGRLADLLGRRKVFMAGVLIFTTASLVCGLSNSEGLLIAGRAFQGVGAALISPAALAIVSTAFTEGSERNKALGVWGALGGCGGAVGMVAGGILTTYAGWEWIFFVNVPVGAAVLALTLPIVRESRAGGRGRSYDPLGAITVTASMILLVYSLSKAPDVGWSAASTIILLIVAAVLLAAFVVIESREREPLLPLSIFRLGSVTGANIVGLAVGATLVGMFFLLTLYVQEVLHYSALKTGVTFLAIGGTSIPAAAAAEVLVGRIGGKAVMGIGMALMGVASALLAFIPIDGSYVSDLLPAYIAAGIGVPFVFVPVSIAALAGVEARLSGVASGLINTTEQIGAALGVAIVSSVFATHAASLLKSGHSPADAFTSGFRLGFWVLVVFCAIGLVAVLTLVHAEHAEVAPEHVHRAATSTLAMNRAATGALSLAMLAGEEEQPATSPSP
jgi:EmrB/QacA subfamily drug resistance transporter